MTATLDCETYSHAGYTWDEQAGKYRPPPGAREPGLSAVGTAVYMEHDSTEILTVSYRLPGAGVQRWRPGLPLPQDLFAYLAAGGLIEHHNAMFERLAWEHLLTGKYGWPPLNPKQQRCSMATARVNTYPGSLDKLGKVLGVTPKVAEGKKLIKLLSVPQKPTKKQPLHRITRADDPALHEANDAYCDGDVITESEASALMPPMTPAELEFWLVDQEINHRGIGVDRPGIRACIVILDQALARYGDECRALTGYDPTQLAELGRWLAMRGVNLPDMQAETIDAMVDRMPPHPPGGQWPARRVLEIRQLIGSASVKKLYAMENQATRADRLVNLLTHHGARTGRPTGHGPQPLNLPRNGPKLAQCACERPYRVTLDACPWCGGRDLALNPDTDKPYRPRWTVEFVDSVLEIMALGSLELVEWFFGDAQLCISGCLRGLFVAGPGMELIASDYSAIEAVVIAMLAGEQWRIEAFNNNEPIYLLSASKITGTPMAEYLDYHHVNKEHHPDRQSKGKVAELAGGFGGWVGAWYAFGATGTEDEVKREVLAWRDASPAIVELWGGQHRGLPWFSGTQRQGHAPEITCFGEVIRPERRWVGRVQEYYGLEGMAVLALLHPGTAHSYRGVTFQTRAMPDGSQALIMTLPSGRHLTYHRAALSPSQRDPASYAITYWTDNTNPKYGPMGWVPMQTYGPKLAENAVQAIAHDIQRFGILALRAAGYPMVLHVYDENVAEVPAGSGSIEEFERIMSTMPPWAADWPIRAAGGWRGRRYRKG